MKKRKHKGTALMLAGIFLLACAAVLLYLNMQRQEDAGDEAAVIVETLRGEIEMQELAETVVDETLPEELQPMPACEVDDRLYVGILQIPKLGLELPIMGDWSDANLQLTPCLYCGSIESENMVIAGHNYSTHFGRLTELSIGDEVIFRTADGEAYSFAVADFETLQPDEIDYMTDGEWPLTLFTCTWGGRSRITVRCEKQYG